MIHRSRLSIETARVLIMSHDRIEFIKKLCKVKFSESANSILGWNWKLKKFFNLISGLSETRYERRITETEDFYSHLKLDRK